ncbi:hypothetical protein [Denitromonas ohlonensis]|uniref:DUF4148 domain-containing protein n=2 Tax=Denitromonas TaxID=139331 RepID=A0A557RVR1_9RHOO|nr:hypothetical protein [Denitromonas ohlonensis]TVO69242.1 hypothetical protein FHP90_01240 [Denitromonas ohlonensis]TVO77342.1 hypothetical protein FHP89_08470 [Denitromonas ohlonensis]TVT50260.1 MAG: hypothetical protein FHP94_04140 [Denitromonas halophila]TVT74931.1 MAG: hypothetical protein FHP93_02400 [Denitromonas halophila]
MNRLRQCSLFVAVLAMSGIAMAQSDDNGISSRQILNDQNRAWRADIRASVSQFAHISADADRPERRQLSDAERLEMRRDIDEAIRKAYGKRQRQRP